MLHTQHLAAAIRSAPVAGRAAGAAILVAAALPGALATQAALAQETQVIEEVTVTGTRIRSPGMTANSPISSIEAQEISLRQPIAVEEIIRSLPWAAPAIGPGTNNGNGGNATIDLRGLGPQRTLVLLDGRRLVPGDLDARVDTNMIPVSLLERLDLVTGGASAVYGADAVTGVVNFITKKDFEGADISGSWGSSEEGDGDRYRVDLTVGANSGDGRGNVTLHAGYTKMDPVLQGDRKLGEASLSSVTGEPEGSSAGVPMATTGTGEGLVQLNPTTGAFEPFFESFNFNPLNYYQTPIERTQLTGLARYEVADNVELYGQALFTRSEVTPNLAPSGTFFNVWNLPIGNPFIPEPARQQICAGQDIAPAECVAGNPTEVALDLRRRFVEFGPRINQHENDMFQYTVGVRGSITDSWSYDAFWSHGESDQARTRADWGSLSKVQQALRVVDLEAGCIDPSRGCVPLNLFGPPGSITPEMIEFINLDSISRRSVEQDVASGFVTGDLGEIKSPWSVYPIGVAVGAEYRKVEANTRSDSAAQIDSEVLGTGAATPDRQGEIEFTEGYAEVMIPIINDQPFIHSLSLEGGYRHTRFKSDSSDTYGSWKYGGEWSPTPGVRFRAMQQRATRAPNINELFEPLITGLSNLAVDPCEGANINAADAGVPGTLSNLCLQTGVPANRIGLVPSPAAGQINNTSGGNPELGPEEADTTTVGVVWQPEFVNGLSVTFDYYRIKIEDAISEASTTDVLTDCYDIGRNPGLEFNLACADIQRSPTTGDLNAGDAFGVLTPLSNLGTLKTDGFDLSIGYVFGLADLGLDQRWGSISFGFVGNYVRSAKFQATPGSLNRECVGFYSVACSPETGNPVPEYKFTQRTTWSFGDFDLSYQWRHISKVKEEGLTSDFLPAFASISAFNWVDLAFNWQATDQIRATLSIFNAFDKSPPNVGNSIGQTTTNSGNTFPQSYDAIGRYYTLGVGVTL
jgi:iron complex outermembrane recepter protein